MKEHITNEVEYCVRASQAAVQYGPGAMVDFKDQTLMTAAPSRWREQTRIIMISVCKKDLKFPILEFLEIKEMNRQENDMEFLMLDFLNGISVQAAEILNLLMNGKKILRHVKQEVNMNKMTLICLNT